MLNAAAKTLSERTGQRTLVLATYAHESGHNIFLKLQTPNQPHHTQEQNTLNNSNNTILDSIASRQRHGETSLLVRIDPRSHTGAMNALPGC